MGSTGLLEKPAAIGTWQVVPAAIVTLVEHTWYFYLRLFFVLFVFCKEMNHCVYKEILATLQ